MGAWGPVEHKGPLSAASSQSLSAGPRRHFSTSVCVAIAGLSTPGQECWDTWGSWLPTPSLNYLPSFNSVSLLLKKMPPGIVSLVLSPANILESWYSLPVTIYRNISTPPWTFPGSPDISQPRVLISKSWKVQEGLPWLRAHFTLLHSNPWAGDDKTPIAVNPSPVERATFQSWIHRGKCCNVT